MQDIRRAAGAAREQVAKLRGFIGFGAGLVVAKAVSVAAQVMLGRVWGPDDYGRITIIIIIAHYLAIPMANGWSTAYVRMRTSGDEEVAGEALNALLKVFFVASLAVAVLYLSTSSHLQSFLNLSPRHAPATLAIAFAYAAFLLAKSWAQANQDWRRYVAMDITSTSTLLALIAVCALLGSVSVKAVIIAFTMAYATAMLWSLSGVAHALRSGTRKHALKGLLSHGAPLVLNALVGTLAFSLDRLLIQRSLGAADVGIYQAHFLATYGVISALTTATYTYLFPRLCADPNHPMTRLPRAIVSWCYILVFFACIATGVLLLWAYRYPLSIPTLIALSLFNAVHFHSQMKAWTLASRGALSSWLVLGGHVLFLFVNLAALLLLIGRIGIAAGGIALLLGACIALLFMTLTEQRVARHA